MKGLENWNELLLIKHTYIAKFMYSYCSDRDIAHIMDITRSMENDRVNIETNIDADW